MLFLAQLPPLLTLKHKNERIYNILRLFKPQPGPQVLIQVYSLIYTISSISIRLWYQRVPQNYLQSTKSG